MLDHDRGDLRQLLNLMAHRLAHRHPLSLQKHMPAHAARRPVHDHLIDSHRRQQLPTMPLMTRLSAPRLARTTLGPRRLALLGRRRVTRRRPRRIPGALRQLALQTIHPSRQLLNLAIHPQQHLDHDLTARAIDRLSLTPVHTPRFDDAQLCPPDQLNAYEKRSIGRHFRERAVVARAGF